MLQPASLPACVPACLRQRVGCNDMLFRRRPRLPSLLLESLMEAAIRATWAGMGVQQGQGGRHQGPASAWPVWEGDRDLEAISPMRQVRPPTPLPPGRRGKHTSTQASKARDRWRRFMAKDDGPTTSKPRAGSFIPSFILFSSSITRYQPTNHPSLSLSPAPSFPTDRRKVAGWTLDLGPWYLGLEHLVCCSQKVKPNVNPCQQNGPAPKNCLVVPANLPKYFPTLLASLFWCR